MAYNQITALGGIAPGPDPKGPDRKEIRQLIFEVLNSDGFEFSWNCASQPYHGTLYVGGEGTLDLFIYAWRITNAGRVKRVSEKRIQVNKDVNRVGFIREITPTEKTLLLGVYNSPHGEPIFAAWAADDPQLLNPRQRSMYVDIEDLQQAIMERIHQCTNSNGDKIFTFLPKYLGDYIDLVSAGNRFSGISHNAAGAGATPTLVQEVDRTITAHKKARTIRSVEKLLSSIAQIEDTERNAITTQRIGQGYFKDLLLNRYTGKCALCDITTRSMLVGSHIKEWSASSNDEKLDAANGLLLCAHHDALFDKHLISFDQDGRLIVSPTLSEEEKKALNIDQIPDITVTEEMKPFLSYHLGKLKR